jgi:hypothetical protein
MSDIAQWVVWYIVHASDTHLNGLIQKERKKFQNKNLSHFISLKDLSVFAC